MNNDNIPHIAYKDFLLNQEAPDPESDKQKAIDFWLKHIGYCRSGVYVGGIFISGWLYWHLNFFKIPRDKKDDYGEWDRVVDVPKLRDNEFLIDWAIRKAKRESKPLMIFGSRRIAKSTIISSRTSFTNYIKKNSGSVIVGGSSTDIANITDYFDKFYENRAECYKDLKKFGVWTKEGGNIEIAFSKKESGKKDPVTKQPRKVHPVTYELVDAGEDDKNIYSHIAVRNLEQGQKETKEELLAGITPSEVILDECGKFHYSKPFSALKPALMTDTGEYRTIPILVGTGGNLSLSENAEKDFLNTEDRGFCHIDLEEYKSYINEEYFRFQQKTNAKVGLFPPAEMSMAGGQKTEIPLSEYVNKDFTEQELKDLEGFNIEVTDWENAKKNIEKLIEQEYAASDERGKKAQMYYPFQPEDCFLHIGDNPFPAEEARKTKNALLERGMEGEFVELEQDNYGNVIANESDKKIIREFPFSGGTHDAPVVIYERPIKEDAALIEYGTYVAGFDGYKISTSETTDSVGVLYIYKRNCGLSGYRNQIVASLATRPSQDKKFYKQVALLLKMYNAELLPERDTNLYKYMESMNMLNYWANCKNLVQGITPNSKADTMYGLPPTKANQERYHKLIQSYCNEDILVGYENDNETPIYNKGVEYITDPMLLEEIENYGKYPNYDRIVAFGHALAWDAELKTRGIEGGTRESYRNVDPEELIKKHKKKRKLTNRH